MTELCSFSRYEALKSRQPRLSACEATQGKRLWCHWPSPSGPPPYMVSYWCSILTYNLCSFMKYKAPKISMTTTFQSLNSKSNCAIGLSVCGSLIPFNSNMWASCFFTRYKRHRNLGKLEFDLSRSLKVNCYGTTSRPIYCLLLMFNSNTWPKSAPFQDKRLWYLSDLDFSFQGHARSDMVPLDPPSIVFYWSLIVTYGLIGLLYEIYRLQNGYIGFKIWPSRLLNGKSYCAIGLSTYSFVSTFNNNMAKLLLYEIWDWNLSGLEFDLSRSLKAKCYDYWTAHIWLPFMFNSNMVLDFKIWALKSQGPWLSSFNVIQGQILWCHWTPRVWFPIDV